MDSGRHRLSENNSPGDAAQTWPTGNTFPNTPQLGRLCNERSGLAYNHPTAPPNICGYSSCFAPMANSLPVTTVDLQAKAMDIASRLGSLIHFLEAASELLTCRNLTTTSFERYSKKVIYPYPLCSEFFVLISKFTPRLWHWSR